MSGACAELKSRPSQATMILMMYVYVRMCVLVWCGALVVCCCAGVVVLMWCVVVLVPVWCSGDAAMW